jgi:hypothetical protein
MDKTALLKPLQIRFTEPADIEAYGDDWHTYDELDLVTRPARDLIRLEAEIGITLVDAMRGVREDSALGNTVCAWLAVRAGGSNVAFAEFSPAIMLAQWRTRPEDEEVPKEDLGAVLLPTPEDLASEAPEFLETAPPRAATATGTVPAATVVLQTMPVVGSGF